MLVRQLNSSGGCINDKKVKRDLDDKSRMYNLMNKFHAWPNILIEWRKVNRMKSLNQRLYDQLGGSIIFILNYTETNNIPLPNHDILSIGR
jgi:hypothetical protein